MQNENGRACGAAVETLENRKYLSTINIADFGAKPNDGAHDDAAIHRALAASRAGDTLLFSGGTFDVGGDMLWPENRTFAS